MKLLLKFHSTLTGEVDENIKNLKSLKQIMINITIYRSKPRLRIFSGKKNALPSQATHSQTKLFTFKFSFSIMQRKPKINKYP